MNSPAHRPVVVADVDTGIDDALAITYLGYLHRRELIELRITTSAGNCTAEQSAANSAEIMNSLTLSDVPITPGAPQPRVLPLTTTPETHGPTGLGYHTTRAAMPDSGSAAAAVELWKGADYLLVAGPATNVAWAAENAPEVLNAIPHVTFMTALSITQATPHPPPSGMRGLIHTRSKRCSRITAVTLSGPRYAHSTLRSPCSLPHNALSNGASTARNQSFRYLATPSASISNSTNR